MGSIRAECLHQRSDITRGLSTLWNCRLSDYGDAVKTDRTESHGRGFESGERYIQSPTQSSPLFSKTYRAA